MTHADFPTIDKHLPDMMAFATDLARAQRSGELSSWKALAQRVESFFTPATLDRVEQVAPGWRRMAAQGKGVTQVHVMCAFMGLITSPEYEQASPDQQALAKWVVLFHDMAKRVQPGKHDDTHAFRSATLAAAALPAIGFRSTADYANHRDAWFHLVHGARVASDIHGPVVAIQDNTQLPRILKGIDRLFGRGSPAARIVKTVLLHHSITMIETYPVSAPLTQHDIQTHLDDETLPLLKLMSLADSDGWELFNMDTRERYRRQTLDVFERLESGA